MKRQQIEELFYGSPELQRRFTQDFPILPDVWIAYGKTPDKRVELLLTPHNDSDAARLARALRERLAIDAKSAGGPHGTAERDRTDRPRVLFNESVVLASLSFRELARDAMPLTDWWKRVVIPIGGVWQFESLQAFAAALDGSERAAGEPRLAGADPRLLKKLIRIVGCIELDRQGRP